MFATRRIRSGQRLIEYLGERITHEEADRRYDDKDGRHHTFLFVLDDDTVLDARTQGSDARYINHSCDPNCESVTEDGHIWINAIRTIREDEELLYDYRFEWDDAYEPHDIRYYACRCGAEKCRGTILRVPAYLRPTVKEWLAGNDVPKPKNPRKKSKKKAAKKVKQAEKAKEEKKAKKENKKEDKKASKKAKKPKKTKKKKAG